MNKFNKFNECYTITFGDCAENHRNMQIIGSKEDNGYDKSDLKIIKKYFKKKGFESKLYLLNQALPDDITATDAYILVIKNGLSALVNANDFHQEQTDLDKDSKALMYGRVVNKKARHNLCFGEESQEADYESGMGTIVAFKDVPLLNKVRKEIFKITGDKLVAEGNYYYDLKKCGIGYHGDTERAKVIAIRTGATFPICYQWFLEGKPVGDTLKFDLDHGDIYVMSEKATGNDWKKRNILTLRHAAGSDKFINL